MSNLRTLPVVLIAWTATALSAFGAEGRTPIFRPGTTLSTAGKYFVARNLSAGSGSIISITASNVDIDLNGFVLDATGGSSPVIQASGVDGVTIRNGTLLGGSRSIEISNGTRVTIEDLQATGTGLGILLLDTTEFSIRRTTLRHLGTGIHVGGSGSPTTTGTIEDNILEDCGQAMRLESMDGCAVVNNRVRNAPNNGVQLFNSANCLISKNTLEQATLRLSSSHRTAISHNVISNAPPGNIGIDLGGNDNFVLNNLVTQGASIGILAGGDRNHLEGNISNSNSNWGFAFIGDDNIYRGNTALGNSGVAGSPPACVAPCSPDFCIYSTSTGNSSLGDNRLPGPPAFPACI
jgi:parallel beta-helix repeat protein